MEKHHKFSIWYVLLGILDPALLRPGRFDRQVLVDRPDRQGRAEILKVHLKTIQLETDVDVDVIAGMTPGMVGADLANLINEAALLAVRRGKKKVALSEFEEAVEWIVAGLEKKNRLINKDEREIVAFHEMGHAIVALQLPGTDPVQKISIIPRGIAALGYTMQVPTEDRFLMKKTEMAEMIDNEVRDIIGAQYERAVKILGDRWDVLDRGARMLLEKEKIEKEEIAALMETGATADTP